MKKTAFSICENKDADQLRGNRKADQRLCFRYIDSTFPLLPIYKIFKPLTIFCGCTAWFVSDLVGNPKTGFLTTRLKLFTRSHIATTMPKQIKIQRKIHQENMSV